MAIWPAEEPDQALRELVCDVVQQNTVTSIFYFCGASRADVLFLLGLGGIQVAGMSDFLGPETPGLEMVTWYEEGMPKVVQLYIDCWGVGSPLPGFAHNLPLRQVSHILTNADLGPCSPYRQERATGSWRLLTLDQRPARGGTDA